ncbi:unnamed protein product [Hermetia illucens]|uniref:ZP domain-containing protein n=1 Tax=Hermetia illucens TaxID=343691 RepID=A0A7R8U9W0_HERIL|nr:uncharacterized protein LOC119661726 [Hermetia illucens]CAD7076855.1 unnamed protein product [Hermetia illucens]
MLMPSTIHLCIFGILIGFTQAKESHKVHCTEDVMRVEIAIPMGKASETEIYLEGLKGYPDVRCQPKVNETWAEFTLSLEDFYTCGITRMVNKLTGKKVYYHKIIIEEEEGKEIVSVKCITTGPVYNVLNRTHTVSKRDVLPAGFQEAEDLDITMSYTKNAPEPIIDVGVRQGGQRVTGELNVSPGTPLVMEIFLDKTSAPVYGLGVTYMEVTDTKNQEETIIFNGCSIDPYLFENFNTVDGDFLSAKFRAFKFPESTYVQFRATVNVCLDKCQGTSCSNGQIGYGRRRREIRPNADPNKVYEFAVGTFIKVSDIEGIKKGEILELEEKLRQLQLVNQKLARNSRGSASEHDMPMYPKDSATVVEEETLLKIAATSRSSSFTSYSPILLVIGALVKLLL